MRELYVVMVFVLLTTAGFVAPFVFGLGYVWVDVFYPQYVVSLLSQFPVALITGGGAILGYIVMDRRSPPRLTLHTCLVLLFILWISLTTSWAVVPDPAFFKWNWAVKTVAFSVFIPFIFRTRVHIEAFLLVYVFSASANIIPFGVKTLMGSGGYGRTLGLLGRNIGLGEGSALSTVSIASIPVLLYFWNHSQILPKTRWTKVMLGGLLVCAVMAPIGTVARTALIGYAVIGFFIWLRSRRKVAVGILMAVAVVGILATTSKSWVDRMNTIDAPTSEASASTRLLVWKWTWDYVREHPLGGGFDVYRINVLTHDGSDNNGQSWTETGRAFHSTYFELLGEHGFVGIGLFLMVALTSVMYLREVLRKTRDIPELEWCNTLAYVLLTSLLAILACAAFIGIGFQSVIWNFFTLPVSLREYVHRVTRPETKFSPRTSGAYPQRLPAMGSRLTSR